MQPLPTETGPRSVCAHCATPLPPPNGSPTFVYGVGAVGYQSCPSCGAKWRYLWQDQPEVRVKPDRSRRTVFVLGSAVLVVLLVVGGVAFAGSQPWSRDNDPRGQTTPSTPRTTASTTLSSAGPVDVAARGKYVAIAVPMDKDRSEFMTWLVGSATATPQYEVNEITNAYVQSARAEIRSLETNPWPADVVGRVDALVDAARRFVDDLEPILHGQAGSLSYVTMITDEASAVHDADNAVRQTLALDPVPE